MKINYLLSTFSFLTFSFAVFGQEHQSSVKRISITDIYIYSGFTLERTNRNSFSDFQLLAPQSELLNNDMTGFADGNGLGISGNSNLSIMLGIQFSDKEKSFYKANPLLRLGLSYSSGSAVSGGLHKEHRSPHDTLVSNQTGQSIYIDSIISESYGMQYSSEQLRIDGSLIFRTNPEARWSIYTGLGISAGISINANTRISYNESKRIDEYKKLQNYSSNNYISNKYESEVFTNKINFGFTTYIPMGIDFRIGNKRDFWKRTHLFYELRPALNISSIPELRTITNVSFQQGIGLRVTFN